MQLYLAITSSIVLLIFSTNLQVVAASNQYQFQTEKPTTLHLQVGMGGSYIENYALLFLSELEKELSQNNVSLDWRLSTDDSNQPIPQPNMYLILSPNQADSDAKVVISAFPSPSGENLLDLSPILLNSYELQQWKETPYAQSDEATTEVVLHFVTALSLYSLHQCHQAEQYFSTVQAALPALHLDTPNFQAAIDFYRGNCALMNRDFEQASRLFENSLKANPQMPWFTNAPAVNLAWVYVKLGRSEEAFQLMDAEVAKFSPIYNFGLITIALQQRAQLHTLAFQYDEAVADLDLIIQYCLATDTVTQPYCAHFYAQRGQTYLLLYQWDNALADYNTAIELDSTYADAYFYRGILKYSILQTGQSLYAEALADFQHYLDLAPNGTHAKEAVRHATDIQTQLVALNH